MFTEVLLRRPFAQIQRRVQFAHSLGMPPAFQAKNERVVEAVHSPAIPSFILSLANVYFQRQRTFIKKWGPAETRANRTLVCGNLRAFTWQV